ncbi:MAG: ATPase domain-containing protein [Ignisphaera sp.]
MSKDLIFGVYGLDKMFGDLLASPSAIVIAGHPGSGKTTLASTICYANAVNGNKCLYISFQEGKERLFNVAKKLGLDMHSAESSGYLKFVKFPVTLAIDSIVSEISALITSYTPRIVVIDSINVLLDAVGKSLAKRAWLQNYFYELSNTINGLVILIAELPFGHETLDLGSLEFVADAIFILKHRIEKGFLVRYMEVRKARGALIMVSEFPFMIVEGAGFVLHPIEVPLTISPEGERLDIVCDSFKNSIGYVRRGEVIYVSHPPNARIFERREMPIYLLAFALKNNLRIFVLSFRYSAETLKNIFIEGIESLGIDSSKAKKAVEKHFSFMGINPFAISPSYYPYQLVRPLGAVDAIVFHGLETRYMSMSYRDYVARFFEVASRLKDEKVLDIVVASRISKKQYNTDASLSDIVVKVLLGKKGEIYARIWRKGGEPQLLTSETLVKCYDEMKKVLVDNI